MDDEFDRYIGLCLKNWVATQPIPLSHKSRLMSLVASYPAHESHLLKRIAAEFRNRNSKSESPVYIKNNWNSTGLLTLSPAWVFHISMNYRLAN